MLGLMTVKESHVARVRRCFFVLKLAMLGSARNDCVLLASLTAQESDNYALSSSSLNTDFC